MSYPSDVTDSQWAQIQPFFEGENRGKHFKEHEKRNLLNAVLYFVKTGCQWRQIPNDFPKWQTVYSFFSRAKRSGLWEKITDALVKKTRVKSGRQETPSYCLIDSQSVKTVYASKERGIDGGKKRKGASGI
jgi:transposase